MLKNHLSRCPKLQAQARQSVKDQLASQEKYSTSVMTTEKLTERLLRCAISGNISFKAATNPEIMSLLREAWPNINMPDRRALRKCLMKVATDAEHDLKARLITNESKISLALDCWTSSNNISFMGM